MFSGLRSRSITLAGGQLRGHLGFENTALKHFLVQFSYPSSCEDFPVKSRHHIEWASNFAGAHNAGIGNSDDIRVFVSRRKAISFLNLARLLADACGSESTFTATCAPSVAVPPKTRPAPPSPINSSMTYVPNAVSSVAGSLSFSTLTIFRSDGASVGQDQNYKLALIWLSVPRTTNAIPNQPRTP